MQDSLKSLLTFNATQKMQQATMSMMVQNMATKEEINKLFMKFNLKDKDKPDKIKSRYPWHKHFPEDINNYDNNYITEIKTLSMLDIKII